MADNAVAEYLANTETVTESVPYRPRVLEGTHAVPEEVAESIDALTRGAVETKTKQEKYTMYDRYGMPWTVVSDRMEMMLKEKDGKSNRRLFFARPPKDAPLCVDRATDEQIANQTPLLLMVTCSICAGMGKTKIIRENPWFHGAQPVQDRDDEKWRKDLLLFQHVYKRHRNQVPRIFRDKDHRDDLVRYTA